MIFQAASREGSDIKEGGTNAGCAWCSCSSGDSYVTNWLASWVKGHLRKNTSHSNWKFAWKELTMYFASHSNFYCWFYWSLQGDNSCLDVCGCTIYTTSWGVHGWNCHHCCEARCRVGFYIAFSEIMKYVFWSYASSSGSYWFLAQDRCIIVQETIWHLLPTKFQLVGVMQKIQSLQFYSQDWVG